MHARCPAIDRSNATIESIPVTNSRNGAHFRSTTQSILALGKVSRNAATAGRVWTRSPREPRRTSRKLRVSLSDMRERAEPRQQVARGVLLRIAHDGDAHAESPGRFALGHGLHGVIGSLRVHVRAQGREQRVTSVSSNITT